VLIDKYHEVNKQIINDIALYLDGRPSATNPIDWNLVEMYMLKNFTDEQKYSYAEYLLNYIDADVPYGICVSDVYDVLTQPLYIRCKAFLAAVNKNHD
jgi:protein tyrosine/serine phosphatase